MTKVTAKDVAKRAGVSVAAVSRAFRPDAPLAEGKRALIKSIALELGYRTPAGRLEAARSEGTIAVVAGDLGNPFYASVTEELSRQLTERKARMLFHAVPRGQDVDAVMRQVLAYRSDGAILTSATLSSKLAEACRQNGIPVVLLNRVQADKGMMAVCCDNYGGARKVAARFLAGGRRRIGFLAGRRDTSTQLERARGFRDQLTEAGQGIVLQAEGAFDYDIARAAAEEMFRARPAIDALFCANDLMALAALNAARAIGVRVPEDVAIIGFDDIPMASWEAYNLTTIRQPVRRMLVQALDLISDTQAREAGDIRILPGEMMIRGSG